MKIGKFLRALLLSLSLSPLAALAAEPVDLNSADVAALERVVGIGPAKAKAIVDYRNEHGPFASVDDLSKVSGFGAKSVEKLRPQLTVSAPKKVASQAAAPNPAAAKK